MTSKAAQARAERDRQRVADAWVQIDDMVRGVADMLADVDFAPRDLDAIAELGSRGRILWAHALDLQKLTRKIAESPSRRTGSSK
jgi:hypothetical protein